MKPEDLQQRLEQYQMRLAEYEGRIEQLEHELQRNRQQLIQDPATRLFTSSFFHSRLFDELSRSERYRHFLSLVIIHIDVDTSPSPVAHEREELRKIGTEIAAGLIRRTDMVAEYGTHQLIVMLPETDPNGAGHVIERYRQVFPNNGRRLHYSALSYPTDASNLEMMVGRLQETSENLYRDIDAEAEHHKNNA